MAVGQTEKQHLGSCVIPIS